MTHVVLYTFLVTMHGQARSINTDFATPAAACQSALVLEVQLREHPQGDPDATVDVLPRNGAAPCPPRSRS